MFRVKVSLSHRLSEVSVTSPNKQTLSQGDTAIEQDDPATREIVPGRETTIEIQKGKTGLGLSIIGGSDTLLVGFLCEIFRLSIRIRQDSGVFKDEIFKSFKEINLYIVVVSMK